MVLYGRAGNQQTDLDPRQTDPPRNEKSRNEKRERQKRETRNARKLHGQKRAAALPSFAPAKQGSGTGQTRFGKVEKIASFFLVMCDQAGGVLNMKLQKTKK